jgi:hypothetical protein
MAEIRGRLDRNRRSASPKSVIAMPETTSRLGPKYAVDFRVGHADLCLLVLEVKGGGIAHDGLASR